MVKKRGGPTDNIQNCSKGIIQWGHQLTVHHHSDMEHVMVNIDCELDRIHEMNL